MSEDTVIRFWTLAENHRRSVLETLMDGLWPSGGLGGPDPEADARHLAIAHVLCSIPEDSYGKLKDAAYSFHWYIPHYETYGEIQPFPVTTEEDDPYIYSKTLYLSPRLERAAWDIAVAVVAHELAHLALDHKLFAGEEYDAQEKEAWALVYEWGFEREARKHRALLKRRGTWERRLIEKLETQQRSGNEGDSRIGP